MTVEPGVLERHPAVGFGALAPRHVEVWLPPQYLSGPEARFPVIYAHDGQNLFDPEVSFIGVAWDVHRALAELAAQGRVRPAIVVGIWNTAERFAEYMPAWPFHRVLDDRRREAIAAEHGPPRSDEYLACIVNHLKPGIDAAYRTAAGPEDTFIMGSSMGALVSLYALCEYPQIFSRAACLSTHWPIGDGMVIEYLEHALPRPGTHRIYFDHGSETLDAQYEPYQRRVDEVMKTAGYRTGMDWTTLSFPGAEHSERAWRARVDEPLRFLLR